MITIKGEMRRYLEDRKEPTIKLREEGENNFTQTNFELTLEIFQIIQKEEEGKKRRRREKIFI